MFLNKISLKELSNKMFESFISNSMDMSEHGSVFSSLMDKYNFRYMSVDDIDQSFIYDMATDSVEDLFLDKINRMGISEKIFYDIAFEFIEPIKVEDHLLIPNRLIPANF